MTRTVAGIQARMSSTRLPGKSLADLGGAPLIARVVDRVRAAKRVEEVVVLTSVDASDDPLAAWLESANIQVRRGPLEDVLARYLALEAEFGPDYVVRVTGDCPLVEPTFIDAQVDALEAFDGDSCWVGLPGIDGTLGGQSVFSARALRLAGASENPLDREHVGSFFFREQAHLLRIVELEVSDAFVRPGLRLQVDEPADLDFMNRLFREIDDAEVSLIEILAWLESDGQVTNGGVVESMANRAIRAMDKEARVSTVGRWSHNAVS